MEISRLTELMLGWCSGGRLHGGTLTGVLNSDHGHVRVEVVIPPPPEYFEGEMMGRRKARRSRNHPSNLSYIQNKILDALDPTKVGSKVRTLKDMTEEEKEVIRKRYEKQDKK